METIILPHSFVRLIQYDKEAQTLFLTMQKGKQYKFINFTEEAFNLLKMANNKGNYIANNILKHHQGALNGIVPQSEISRIANYQKFLAS